MRYETEHSRHAGLPAAEVVGHTRYTPGQASRSSWIMHRLRRHWLGTALVLLGLYMGLPWLAPLFSRWGWTGAANVIYTAYATQCHQLPQRSFFLFGARTMYPLSDIQAAFQPTAEPRVLRQFVGNAEMGWKVAWSDRMVWMYGALFVAGLVYALVRRYIKPVPWHVMAVLVLPMVLDGLSHMLSDVGGIGAGFRETNGWLAYLTKHRFAPDFYAGDALGSFNAWLRLISGILFGLGVGAFAFPWLDRLFGAVWPERAAPVG